MTALLIDRIKRHIQTNGPLPLAEYMHWCLADKTHGYYQTQNAFGRKGDFITAPEVSQMFGELIGVWLIKTWHTLGSPTPFSLIELGPGNGTLMNDILRAVRVDPEFLAGARVTLVETSERLVSKQRKKLSGFENIEWQQSLDEAPSMPSLIVANEFLDALPFRQYVKADGQWRENCVGLNDDGELSWVLGSGILDPDSLPTRHDKESEGAVFEISTVRETIVENIAHRLSEKGGAALLIDYGHAKSGFGDTFQGISAHSHTDPLLNPGEADLTSHVDFEPLVSVAEKSGCVAMPVLTQGEFLLRLGLLERAGALGSGKSADEQKRITLEAERLALPQEMGDLFKVLAVSSEPNLWPFTETA